MKIDIDYFDNKKRFYCFYISIGWDHFLFALCIADYEIQLGTMKYKSWDDRDE